MKLYYLFSRNKKIGSRLIAWSSGLLIKDLEKIPSHVALLLDFGNTQFVVESVLESGVRLIPYSVWLEINEECYKIPCASEFRDPDEIFSIIQNIWGKKYDWPGLCFFALSFVKHLVFKIPFPDTNRWEKGDRYFCTEAVGILSGYKKYSMTTPAKMCLDFLNGF